MITIKWVGEFKNELGRKHVSRLTFSGYSLKDINKQIREFVDCMEDGAGDWVLQYNCIEGASVKDTPCKK